MLIYSDGLSMNMYLTEGGKGDKLVSRIVSFLSHIYGDASNIGIYSFYNLGGGSRRHGGLKAKHVEFWIMQCELDYW